MEHTAQTLLTIGSILLLGLATDLIGRKTSLPRVTLLLVFGVLIGNEVLGIIPPFILNHFELIADMTLVMIGFLLGGKLTTGLLRSMGNQLLAISIFTVIVTALLVTVGLVLLGVPYEIALLLGCIATATDPVATVDVVKEYGSKGRFSDLLFSIVVLDDAWGLILFSLGLAVVASLTGTNVDIPPTLFLVREIGGAILLGVAIGLPAAYLTGRIRPGQPMLAEALGIVFICGGAAIWLGVSFLIASMVMGVVVTNIAQHHEYPFHAIEGVEWPFMVIFFVLAGAYLEFDALLDIGFIGMIYILSRIAGKYLGSLIGGTISNANKEVKNWMGIALMPQAGAAMGMALIASNYFPESRQMILSVIISTTIFFEITGPVFTRVALKKGATE